MGTAQPKMGSQVTTLMCHKRGGSVVVTIIGWAKMLYKCPLDSEWNIQSAIDLGKKTRLAWGQPNSVAICIVFHCIILMYMRL